MFCLKGFKKNQGSSTNPPQINPKIKLLVSVGFQFAVISDELRPPFSFRFHDSHVTLADIFDTYQVS